MRKILKLFLAICFGFLVPQAAFSQNWSDVDIRQIKPGMTYAEVEALVAQQWPQVQLRKEFYTLRFQKESFRYIAKVSFKTYGEKSESLTIQFFPPKSMDAGDGASRVKHINRYIHFEKKQILIAPFVKKLITKYGPATVEVEAEGSNDGVTWLFDADQKLLDHHRLKNLLDQTLQACGFINVKGEDLIVYKRTGSHNRSHRDLQYKWSRLARDCRDKKLSQTLMKLFSCSQGQKSDFCPASLRYQWRKIRGVNELMNGFYVLLDGGRPQRDKDRALQANLQKELKARALVIMKKRGSTGSEIDL